jgi:di/tripeptidase
MHGDDERLSVASFNKGVAVLLHIVSDFAVAK